MISLFSFLKTKSFSPITISHLVSKLLRDVSSSKTDKRSVYCSVSLKELIESHVHSQHRVTVPCFLAHNNLLPTWKPKICAPSAGRRLPPEPVSVTVVTRSAWNALSSGPLAKIGAPSARLVSSASPGIHKERPNPKRSRRRISSISDELTMSW